MNLRIPSLHTTSRLAAQALAVALALALAGCGGPPAPGTTGDATTSEGHPAAGQDRDDAAEDRLRVPVDGTLLYSVALSGELHTTGPHAGEKRDATIRRRIEINTRVHAVLGNGPLAAANADHPQVAEPEPSHARLDELNRQQDACGEDAACLMKLSMRMAGDKQLHKEIENAGRHAIAMIGRTAVYSQRAPCEGRASIDDTDERVTWWEDIGEGYHKTGLATRKTAAQADAAFDCKPNLFSDDPEVARHLIAEGTLLYLDKQTGEYDLTIAPQQVQAAVTVDDKPAAPRPLGIPRIALTGMDGAAVDQPLRGRKTVDLPSEDGVPLRADIEWSFTPDRS